MLNVKVKCDDVLSSNIATKDHRNETSSSDDNHMKNLVPLGNSSSDMPTIAQTYETSSIEDYLMKNLVPLGYGKRASGCTIWKDPNATEIHADLMEFAKSLQAYNEAVEEFNEIPDLMKSIIASGGKHDVCESAKVHPDNFKAFFNLTLLSKGKNGYMEPLTPPMRHHSYCWRRRHLFDLKYILHDYEAMCRALKPHSKRVFIDLGASLKFHEGKNPVIDILTQFKKFGFHFDHIYAFEITQLSPQEVFKDLLPEEYMASYHWINIVQ